MSSQPGIRALWWRWLVVAAWVVILFGLAMVLAPGFTLRLFGLLLYSSSGHMESFGAEAVTYLSLTHGVLGAVMVGWGITLLFAALGPFRRGSREGWRIIAVSLAVWFVLDTAFSLWSGFWQNAVLNLGLAILFAVPLAATYRAFHQPDA